MKKSLYFLMVVGLAGGLVACGGGSSSGEPGDTTDRDTDNDNETIADCSSGFNFTANNLIPVGGSTSLDSAIATAKQESDLVNSESLDGLWVIAADFETSETLSDNQVLFEQGQALKVFQIASTGVQDEIEIIECSRNYWDSGEFIAFGEPGNDYDGSAGGFSFNETQILFFADRDASFDATIVSNTEIAFSSYDLDLPLSDGAKNISGRANNIVAYKIRDSAQCGLGSISYNTDNFDVLCSQVIASEARTGSAQGDLVSQDLGFIVDGASYVDGKLNKKTRLLIADSRDEIGQSSKYAFIGANALELEEFFDSDVALSLSDDLSFSGSLGSSVTFEGDIKNIVGE